MLLACVICAVEAISSPAQTFTSLLSFDEADGYEPSTGSVVQSTDGNYYGTTTLGGDLSCDPPYGCGTVFKITPTGTLTTLHSFDGTDGSYPNGLVLATNGKLYGTTELGGANSYGTVFEITAAGVLTTLYSFCSQANCSDGAGPGPAAGLVQGSDGNFYGTTSGGGGSTACNGCGTVFKITPAGILSTLHSFDGTDGEDPWAGLIQATDGNFYGTTWAGGANSCFGGGCGTVFKITPAGILSTLHSFDGADGQLPIAALIQATNGNLYGTTQTGGAYTWGTVFEITPTGSFTTLHNFDSSDGGTLYAGLVQGTDGNLYGATSVGGTSTASCPYPYGCGTIFSITTNGTLTTLHNFNGTDGSSRVGGLTQATSGSFYGTTSFGGSSSNCENGCGTVFSLAVGLGPFVETNPTSGKVGTRVRILGTNLSGATSVTFNGTPAFFKVRSSSEIGTVVPPGATTGFVRVTTPGGTLTSNVIFRAP
ncbi:MAG TPA: choice-of-anchor tandem repeat GloVer-containing protein [Terriglobia bacterium]|nr:choice-of-anchor tandem repeat GloVer-containing protein [Terriglobia bacterium]